MGTASVNAEQKSPYDHESLQFQRNILRWMMRHIGFRFLAKVEGIEGVENIPSEGPAIIIYNHIAFVDPVVIMGLMPRNVVPIAKAESYNEPIWGIFPKLWDSIPVKRDEVDRGALRAMLNVLRAGETILIAPEGTRNENLQEGKEGVAYLAIKSSAPVVPVAIYGTKGFPSINPKRWREEGATVRVGRPFRFRETPDRVGLEHLRKMTDEAMYKLAELLPEDLRGVYSDLGKATEDTIVY
jgi:1-acyl-sn-glycerol-3-phosphate acyltransferase